MIWKSDRLEICKKCPRYRDDRCGMLPGWMSVQSVVEVERNRCPIGRWSQPASPQAPKAPRPIPIDIADRIKDLEWR